MITVQEFVNFTNNDLKCTTRSEFSLNINKYKNYINQINETIEADKTILSKVKKSVKTIYNSGTNHCRNEVCFSEQLERLSQNETDDFDVDTDKIASGLSKFAVVMRDLSNKYQQLMQNLNSLIVYPLDMFLKSDIKHDVKRPFERAVKDYEAKAEKLKKDKLNALTKENALTIYRPNGDDLFDFSEDLERERRIVQLQLCEFLIKVNEMKARKGAELVQQLIDYYRTQTTYFKECLSMMEHMGMFMNDLVSHIDEIKNHHTYDIQLLIAVRNELRTIIEKKSTVPSQQQQPGYSLHQPQGNKAYGTSKDGILLKKSDGVVKRVWQRRRVKVTDQSLLLYHGDESKPPVVLPMLTCHIKQPSGDGDLSYCFDLISNNRTYNFRAEDEKSYEEWLSVLSNAKEAVFEQAMSLDNDDEHYGKDNQSTYSTDAALSYTTAGGGMSGTGMGGGNNNYNSNSNVNCSSQISGSGISTSLNSGNNYNSNNNNNNSNNGNNVMISSTISYKNVSADADLSPGQHKRVISRAIRKVQGNDKCADCGCPDPDWVSVNLGVLICLECCGVHRELGVHNSRTQSLKMDTFYASQLLLPRFIGNKLFNSVFEALLTDGVKPVFTDYQTNRSDPNAAMQQRRNFIHAKYIDKKYVNKINSGNSSYLKQDLLQSLQSMDIKSLLQVYGEGADMMSQFALEDDQEIGSLMNTCIHQVLAENDSDTYSFGSVTGDLSSVKRIGTYNLQWEDETVLKTNVALLVIIEFILQNCSQASLKRVNAKGDTILHQAIKMKQVDAVKVILRTGSILPELISARNNDKVTVTELAEQLGHKELIDILNSAVANTNSSTDKDNQHYLNDVLDELSIDWDINSLLAAIPNVPAGSAQVSSSSLQLNEQQQQQQQQPVKTFADQAINQNLNLSVDKQSNHNRSESTGSNMSDTPYVNFNHHIPNPNVSQQESSSVTGGSKKEEKKLSGYKSFLSFNADQKIGLKTHSTPWKDVATLPRKKSLKGPAPEPPAVFKNTNEIPGSYLSEKRSSLCSVQLKSSNQNSHSKDKPTTAPKPKNVALTAELKERFNQSATVKTPQPKVRYKIMSGPGPDYSNCTLPRNMHSSSHRAVFSPNSMYTPLKEPNDEKGSVNSSNNNALRTSSHFSHSSDHIDVLLDVLEEPDKPLNAKEVIHISNQCMDERSQHQSERSNSAKKLVIGEKTVAKFNCEAENMDELSFKKGEVIVVSNSSFEDGWWEGYIDENPNRKGMFPGNFVEKM